MDRLGEPFAQEWERLLALLPKLLSALVVVAIFWFVGRYAARGLERLLGRSRMPGAHTAFFRNLVRWLFVLAGCVAGLDILGWKGVAAGLLAGGSVTTIVLGFAFRGIGENFLAGFFLVMGRTFEVGDVIRSGEFEGVVRDIELRHTHIRAADGRDIFIPSYTLFSSPVVNFTRDGLRRLAFTVGIDYRDDAGRARRLLVETLAGAGLVLEDPAPGVRIKQLAPSYVELEVHFWVDAIKQPDGLVGVPSLVMDRCRTALLEDGFTPSSEVSTNLLVDGLPPLDVRLDRGASGEGGPA